MRMSPRKLPHHSVATDTHPTVETASSDELPLFSARARDLVQQFDVSQGSNCRDCDSDYAPEESDPQWVASEFVNPSGFAELSDFPSGQENLIPNKLSLLRLLIWKGSSSIGGSPFKSAVLHLGQKL
ncbi:uncharacterized protein LOC110433543 [Sorghum bicolor]|uniref:uncharacterized protein LOC110433543 n=1 Tax=Sorghum bicolor TaxID=4558 RepID=UPI000B42495A|nr:uncharacterized protein LOC110433543 [Sorghum bicolor]|eukprot:XP_021311580.1 uncharacterized protein LOC110433543 [Sorghum bicolor]